VGWDGLGQARDCYETTLAYAKERKQFGQPTASFQLIQTKLVEMINEISLAQLLSIHIGRLKDLGELDPATVSMFKVNNVSKARRIATPTYRAVELAALILEGKTLEEATREAEAVWTGSLKEDHHRALELVQSTEDVLQSAMAGRLGLAQLAEYFEISKEQFLELIKSGMLKPAKIPEQQNLLTLTPTSRKPVLQRETPLTRTPSQV
jgi:alkylation response protein AidB-like acyl-CoA dehydrogenase